MLVLNGVTVCTSDCLYWHRDARKSKEAENNRVWTQKNPEYNRVWTQKNPEYHRVWIQNRDEKETEEEM